MFKPKIFEDEEFIQDIERRSKIPETLFYAHEVNRLYLLARERPPYKFLLAVPFFSLPYDEPTTRQLLDKVVENVTKKVKLARLVERASKESDRCEIFNLDDYRLRSC